VRIVLARRREGTLTPMPRTPITVVDAVIFDLDGVLVDSETVWDECRRSVVARHGGSWRADATDAMMGMSSPEWAAYLRDQLGTPLPTSQIIDEVVSLVEDRYRRDLPLMAGAVSAVRDIARQWPLGLASSSNRPIIDLFLDASGLREEFTVSVSSEEVGRGKPAPDVYLEAARRLAVPPQLCAAVEDSANGIRAGAAAGMTVVAVPNTHYPPDSASLELATIVVDDIRDAASEIMRL
jgi:HAD superfamily hydrolase (TIGR01509 family)